MTGDLVTAHDADRLGLVNHVVPRDQVLDEAMAMAQRLAAGPAVAIRFNKRLVNKELEMRVVAALRPVGRVRGHHLRDRRPPRGGRLVPGEAPGHVPLGQARRHVTRRGSDRAGTSRRPRDRPPGPVSAP